MGLQRYAMPIAHQRCVVSEISVELFPIVKWPQHLNHAMQKHILALALLPIAPQIMVER
jgi:hypothetical protein